MNIQEYSYRIKWGQGRQLLTLLDDRKCRILNITVRAMSDGEGRSSSS